jgi:hypothetical protein
MTKQTGMIITIVVAVLTLCCSMTCCASGIYTASTGEVFDTPVEWYYFLPIFCLGILVWVVPLLLWLFLVRGKEDDVEGYIAG